MNKLYSYVIPPWILLIVIAFAVSGYVFTQILGPGSNIPKANCNSIKGCLAQGKQFYKSGFFPPAEKAFKKVLDKDPENAEALAQLGRIAFYKNQLKEAESFFQKALTVDSKNQIAKELLPLVYYRLNEFAKAAPLESELGNQPLSDRLNSFENQPLYQIEAKNETLRVPFIKTDPVPVVRISVNGSAPVDFIIDTGAAELVIDSSLAQRVGAKTFGKSKTGYPGGLQTEYEYGRVDSVSFEESESSSGGNWSIKNVPVHVQNLRALAVIFKDVEIKGIIGTTFLYQFLATIDYPEGALILRKKDAARSTELVALAKSTKEIFSVPFWMAGDHYIVAWGTLNKGAPTLFFVDTGLAGGAFLAPPSTIHQAGITVVEHQGIDGEKDEGRPQGVPFSANELTLGEVKAREVLSFADVFPEKLEYQFGFRIGGIVSHQFFREYAVTFDFISMNIFLEHKEISQ
ncbi:aspartyl protease family protein [Candidatus Acetothermia bacterium]|nr:aspartyl protease family protein [Candidatus Acetothermia bacterium]